MSLFSSGAKMEKYLYFIQIIFKIVSKTKSLTLHAEGPCSDKSVYKVFETSNIVSKPCLSVCLFICPTDRRGRGSVRRTAGQFPSLVR